MGNKVVALQGKNFVIELVSNLGSTNYCWCVTKMPDGIWLADTNVIPVAPGLAGGKTIQQFVFIAAQVPEEEPAGIKFKLACMSDINKESSEYEAEVTVIPSNSKDFVTYSENMADNFDIGLPKRPMVAYGYACSAEGGVEKYGYPCGVNDATVKYGYVCNANNGVMKYGYPCGVNDATLKYGYPCAAQTEAMVYAFVSNGQNNFPGQGGTL